MLKPGDQLNCESGALVTVVKALASGGQGEVYEGRMSDGRAAAIKWYYPQYQSADLRESITTLVQEKAPSAHFLWPEDIVVQGDHFGYVMKLRPDQYASLPQVLGRKVLLRFSELVRAASNTVAAFKALQAKGLFDCDIAEGNLFVDPATGDVLICDNDNVGSPHTTAGAGHAEVHGAGDRARRRAAVRADRHLLHVRAVVHVADQRPPIAGRGRVEDPRAGRAGDAADLRHRPGVHLRPGQRQQQAAGSARERVRVLADLPGGGAQGLHPRVHRGAERSGQAPHVRRVGDAAFAAASDAIRGCSQCGRQNFYCPEAPNAACWGCNACSASRCDC